MSTISYKDYQGDVKYEDGRLVIQVLHIDDLLVAECDRASEVQATFEDMIEDYLATCVQLGKEPSRPFKGSFNVRIPPDMHRRAAMVAARRGESLNSWISTAIKDSLTREQWDDDRDRPLAAAARSRRRSALR